MPKESDLREIIDKLHPFEIKVINNFSRAKSFEELTEATGLQKVEVMRALQWLENKGILKINKTKRIIFELDKNGIEYLKRGLPEKRVLAFVAKKETPINEIIKNFGSEEANASIGILRRKGLIFINRGLVKANKISESFMKSKEPAEEIIEKISKKGIEETEVKKDEKTILNDLIQRKGIIRKKEAVVIGITLTELGKVLAKTKISDDTVTRLTPEMIKTGNWKTKKIRAFDVGINVPEISGGKKHFFTQAEDYMRKIWLSMGFEEMEGNLAETAFWDLDSLFVPQDHPAREMQDTFYLKDKAKNKILEGTFDEKLAKNIKKTHETGGDTGSTGWGGKWSEEEAKKILLRTHTTCLSAKYIHNLKKEDLPKKYFSINRVFRNEAVDWKHLFEFTQVEGIVVDPNATFRDLIGYLKAFFKKMGYLDVRIKPSYFPYTEPSAEVEVLHPVKKEWIELGGAGIFRPEVTKTLMGFECPILAWGLGMERIITEYYKINDLRNMYDNDINDLKSKKWWFK